MAKLRSTLLVFGIAAAGCAADAPSDFDPILEGKADGPPTLAQSGSFVSTMLPLVDGCNMGIEHDDAELIELVASEDGQHFEFDADGATVTCSGADDGSYLCVIPQPESELFSSTEMTIAGRWASADRFEGVVSFTVGCEGEECATLEALLETSMPCTTEGTFLATRARGEDFAVAEGDYDFEVSPPIEGISTCASDALGVLPDTMSVTTGEQDAQFFINDGLPEPIDCSLQEGGAVHCHRFFDLANAGVSFDSSVIGAWTGADRAEATIMVEVDCSDPSMCDEAEEVFGELPCVAYHGIEITASETP